MFFLHALGDDREFEMMRETLETLLATGTLTSQRIIECLEHEAQHLKGGTEEKQAQETIFLAQELRTKSKPQKKKCMNCGYTNHTGPECYRPGGPLHKMKQKEQKEKKKGLMQLRLTAVLVKQIHHCMTLQLFSNSRLAGLSMTRTTQ